MPLPNSLPWMESVDAKMDRAKEHIEELDSEVLAWLGSIKMNLIMKTSPDVANPWLVTYPSDYIPPIRLSTIVGDCVHNMRSALDNLVCGLALTKNRTCDCKDTKFPFTQQEEEWPNAAQNQLLGLSREAKMIVKSLQPWCDPVRPNPLLMLNKLSNTDKHRFCAFALAYNENAGFRVHRIDGTVVEFWPTGRLYLGEAQTFTVPVHTSQIANPVRIEAVGRFTLSFRDDGPWRELPVIDVIHRCFDHIEQNVIARLKPFFEPLTEPHQSGQGTANI